MTTDGDDVFCPILRKMSTKQEAALRSSFVFSFRRPQGKKPIAQLKGVSGPLCTLLFPPSLLAAAVILPLAYVTPLPPLMVVLRLKIFLQYPQKHILAYSSRRPFPLSLPSANLASSLPPQLLPAADLPPFSDRHPFHSSNPVLATPPSASHSPYHSVVASSTIRQARLPSFQATPTPTLYRADDTTSPAPNSVTNPILIGSDDDHDDNNNKVLNQRRYAGRRDTDITTQGKAGLDLNGDVNMDDLTSGSDSDYTKYWIDWFLNTKGNEYFCEVDEEYILDRFNLTGLNTEVQHYAQALDLITDNLEEELDDDMREQVEKSARHLYGLIHARFVITSRGLAKMLEKYKKADFGRCPRVLCHNQPLLPVGLSDIPYTKTVKLYCPRCEDIYNPKSSRHAAIDGAYYGTSFPHMLFQVHPTLLPQKTGERYTPRIFGFKIHDIARQHRWQDGQREEMEQRLREHGAAGGVGSSSASGNGTASGAAGGNGSGASVEGGGQQQKSGFFWVV